VQWVILVGFMAHFSLKQIFAGPLTACLLFLCVTQPSLGVFVLAATSLLASTQDKENDLVPHHSRQAAGQERRSDLNATDSNATGSWLLATDRGAGWRSFDWFGYFYEAASPWVFHSDLGWFYRAGDGTNSIWLYFPGKGLKKDGKPVPTYEEWIAGGKELPADMVFTGGSPWFDESTGQKRQPREVYEMIYGKEGSWMWTEKTTYPYLYDFDAGMWKYFLRSGNSKSLFNYSTGSWESF
jgi:hypothetical protein